MGTAADVEDGTISARIEWRSDLDGLLGTGASITVSLEPGVHTITAEARDSSGASSQAEITVNVGSPPEVAITAPPDGTVVFTDELPLAFVAAAMDGEDGVPGIVRVEKERLEFRLFQPLFEGRHGRRDLGLDVFALGGQLRQDLDLLLFFLQTAERPEVALQFLLALLKGLGFLLILPGGGIGQLGVDGREFGLFPVQVKESP